MVGKWYDNATETVPRKAKRAYSMIARVNHHYFEQIPVKVVFQSQDPYDSYSEMKHMVNKEGFLRVFNGGSEPEHMSKRANLEGRAVHDWFGHLSRDCDFSMKGEWQKYQHVKDRYPKWVRPLLFTEIVGQRAAVSYYEDGFADDNFEQKHAFAPDDIRAFAEYELSND